MIWVEAVWAHGGEEHAAPAAPLLAAQQGDSLVTWSKEYEAVVRLPYAEPTTALVGRALVADWRTSAPVEQGTIAVHWSGPASVDLPDLRPSSPGIFEFSATFPEHGDYSGGLTVIADRADMLGLPVFHYQAPEAHLHPEGWAGAWVLVGIGGGLAAGLLLGGMLGFGTGRWSRASAAAGLLALGISVERPQAHGGEEHAPPPVPARETLSAPGELSMQMESQFLLGVRTDVVRQEPFTESVRILGQAVVRPGGGVELAAPVSGTLTLAPDLRPGNLVTKGQWLGSLQENWSGADRSGVVAAQTSAKVELVRAKRELELAERDAERAKGLGEALSEREQVARRRAVEVAKESVHQAEIAAGEGGGTVTLRAPMSGTLAAMEGAEGQVVAPGEALFTIVSDGPLWVEAHVPESFAGRLKRGASAVLASEGGNPLTATVLNPGLKADPDSGMLHVTLELQDASLGVVPGMSLSGTVTAGKERPALVISEEAIVDSNGESSVFVKTGPETFQARAVRLGHMTAGKREILGGLEVGERVVLEGTYALRSLAGR